MDSLKNFKKKKYQISDTISSISSGMTNNIKSILNLSVVIISYHWMFESFSIFKISSSWWVYVLGFLGIDFANYWTHRWNHEYNILWNRHIIHHSSEEYNLACALRQTISAVFQIYFFIHSIGNYRNTPKSNCSASALALICSILVSYQTY